MVSNNITKRLEWVDIAKAIAIVLMIIGHEVGNEMIRIMIFSFHMPLFFILSGYTSKKVKSWSRWSNKFKKAFKKVWLLAVTMTILLGFEYIIFSNTPNNLVISNVVKGLFWGSNLPNKIFVVGVMWFLFVFFWAKILFDLLQIKLNDLHIGIILLIISGVSYYFCNGFNGYLPQALDIVPFAALFMWIGSLLRKVKIEKKYTFLSLSVLFIFWLICVLFNINIEMSMRSYPLFLVCILEAVAGTMLVCEFSKWLTSRYSLRSIQVVGQQTLALMCIHHLDLYWVNWGGEYSTGH